MDEREAGFLVPPRAHPALEHHGAVGRRAASEDVGTGSHNDDDMKEMRSILFVCTGNICRSPTAEAVLQSLCLRAGIELRIESAGLGDWHVGSPPDERAQHHARGRDYDLSAHTEASGTRLEWVDGEERYTPHVVEPAAGVNRSLLAFMVDAYDEEVVAERPRTLLRLHPQIAPVKVAVLPLIPRNAEIAGKARALYEELRRAVVAEYDDSGQIGRRYRRQDEIGTPWALTVDEQTLEDDTVTIRDRDSLAQERIPVSGARDVVLARLSQEWKTPKTV